MVAHKLPGKKHRQLYPADTNIIQFIERVEAAKRKEKQQGKDKRTASAVISSDQPNLVRLQTELCTAMAKLKLTELFQLCATPADTNRLKCLSNPTSDAHVRLSAIPTDRTLMMSSNAMKHAIRYRLGLQPYDTMPSQCACNVDDAFRCTPYHAFSCRTLRSHGTIFRHNLVLQYLATWTRRAGLFTEVEVNQLSSDDRLQPDMVITNGSEMRIIDVTIVDPLNKSNLARAGVTLHHDMVATTVAEKDKQRKYAKLVAEYGAKFSTAAAETTGGLGMEFRQLIEFISIVAQEEREGWGDERGGEWTAMCSSSSDSSWQCTNCYRE